MVTFHTYFLTMEGQTTTDFYALFARPAIEYEKKLFYTRKEIRKCNHKIPIPYHIIKLIAGILKHILC
jgi:hypothetical protein